MAALARWQFDIVSLEMDCLVRIAGSHNLRDMGGYRTNDGRRTRWEVLYRSGVMVHLSEEAVADFRKLGIVAIVDLRESRERSRQPTLWHEGEGVAFHCRDYDMSAGALEELARSGSAASSALNVIHDVYRMLPFEQRDSYATLFRLLVAGEMPLLFNCTAGKDRTGLAAALILFGLGVPWEEIARDYSLSNLSINRLIAIVQSDPRFASLASLTQERYMPLLRADPDYLRIAFTEIERAHGNVFAYLDNWLGVGPFEIAKLKDALLV